MKDDTPQAANVCRICGWPLTDTDDDLCTACRAMETVKGNPTRTVPEKGAGRTRRGVRTREKTKKRMNPLTRNLLIAVCVLTVIFAALTAASVILYDLYSPERFLDLLDTALANGADTMLGREFENGVDLSGGQWQRIAMARAFLGVKPALILDEPTSQLDPIAESDLYTEFADMSAGRTTIFITHRLASTMITDRILVISDGKIAENGPHDELVKIGGIYAQMYEAQKQWYVKSEGQVTAV